MKDTDPSKCVDPLSIALVASAFQLETDPEPHLSNKNENRSQPRFTLSVSLPPPHKKREEKNVQNRNEFNISR